MIYTIKHFNEPVLQFSAEDGADSDIKVVRITEDKELLPPDLAGTAAENIESWIRHRTIPKNRAYVDNLLSSIGLSFNRPMDIIKVSKGLSLNDCYWVTEEGFDGDFESFNLYDNRFNRVLGLIALTGYGSSAISRFSSSPEFTTNGILPKCWRRENGVIRLYKGGTEGASNTGYEPYSEFYAADIAKRLGVNAIDYSLSRWKDKLCSVCDIFTSKDVSYVPTGRIVRSGGMKAVRAYYETLGEEFVSALDDMIVFDAVIFNTDRHFGNFGLLLDSKTNKIIAPAPLFDHGNSLFNFAGRDALVNEESMRKYAKTLLPCVYDDFVESARKVITPKHKEKLRGLLNIKLKRNSRYNLPPERLRLTEKMISLRVSELLKTK